MFPRMVQFLQYEKIVCISRKISYSQEEDHCIDAKLLLFGCECCIEVMAQIEMFSYRLYGRQKNS
jgi:hypothetical protein